MATLRSGRLEETKQKKRLGIAIVGSIGLLIFFLAFGVKILVGFSLLIDKLRGTTPTQTTQSLILPPVLDTLPAATKSASLKITGTGVDGTDVILYVNDDEKERLTVENNGTFETILTLTEGTNTISARATDGKDGISDPSNTLTVVIKKTPPVFEVTSPAENVTINGDTNRINVEGKTEENTTVTVNGRIVVIRSDNTFSYSYPLNEGENKLTIIAKDAAGNETKAERTVTYHK